MVTNDPNPSSQTPTPPLRSIPLTSGSAAILSILHADGCVVIKNVLTPSQISTINTEIDPPMSTLQPGSVHADPTIRAFHGAHTKRLTNLVTHSRIFRDFLLDHDTIHEICEAIFRAQSGDYWQTTAQVIDIGPAEPAQPLHRDMMQYPVFMDAGPLGPEAAVNFMVALTPFTAANGATRVIPGSHNDTNMWEYDFPERAIPAVMDAGDILLISGKTIHGGGANTTDTVRRGIAWGIQACYLVPEEAYPFFVDLELVKTLSKRAQRMLGFRSVFPRGSPGVWMMDYRDVAERLGI
ncbi:PhyH-domain-containing protein [Aspergillus karnatakaensis]|uniref:phytanoyl-CoA dioxygenase family protein n=1 Tax=Aspergillus karnatakaensis TaxID=1810916 RepID=UPI003CCDC7EA